MTTLFEGCRFVNQILPLVTCGWLGFLTVVSWPADWARPNHVGHYRGVLVAILSYVLLTSMGAAQYEQLDAPVGPISPLYTLQTLGVLLLCWKWPRPSRWREEPS